jgi:hypothetical protein
MWDFIYTREHWIAAMKVRSKLYSLIYTTDLYSLAFSDRNFPLHFVCGLHQTECFVILQTHFLSKPQDNVVRQCRYRLHLNILYRYVPQ